MLWGTDVITRHLVLLAEAVADSFIPSVFHSFTQETFIEYLLCARSAPQI